MSEFEGKVHFEEQEDKTDEIMTFLNNRAENRAAEQNSSMAENSELEAFTTQNFIRKQSDKIRPLGQWMNEYSSKYSIKAKDATLRIQLFLEILQNHENLPEIKNSSVRSLYALQPELDGLARNIPWLRKTSGYEDLFEINDAIQIIEQFAKTSLLKKTIASLRSAVASQNKAAARKKTAKPKQNQSQPVPAEAINPNIMATIVKTAQSLIGVLSELQAIITFKNEDGSVNKKNDQNVKDTKALVKKEHQLHVIRMDNRGLDKVTADNNASKLLDYYEEYKTSQKIHDIKYTIFNEDNQKSLQKFAVEKVYGLTMGEVETAFKNAKEDELGSAKNIAEMLTQMDGILSNAIKNQSQKECYVLENGQTDQRIDVSEFKVQLLNLLPQSLVTKVNKRSSDFEKRLESILINATRLNGKLYKHKFQELSDALSNPKAAKYAKAIVEKGKDWPLGPVHLLWRIDENLKNATDGKFSSILNYYSEEVVTYPFLRQKEIEIRRDLVPSLENAADEYMALSRYSGVHFEVSGETGAANPRATRKEALLQRMVHPSYRLSYHDLAMAIDVNYGSNSDPKNQQITDPNVFELVRTLLRIYQHNALSQFRFEASMSDIKKMDISFTNYYFQFLEASRLFKLYIDQWLHGDGLRKINELLKGIYPSASLVVPLTTLPKAKELESLLANTSFETHRAQFSSLPQLFKSFQTEHQQLTRLIQQINKGLMSLNFNGYSFDGFKFDYTERNFDLLKYFQFIRAAAAYILQVDHYLQTEQKKKDEEKTTLKRELNQSGTNKQKKPLQSSLNRCNNDLKNIKKLLDQVNKMMKLDLMKWGMEAQLLDLNSAVELIADDEKSKGLQFIKTYSQMESQHTLTHCETALDYIRVLKLSESIQSKLFESIVQHGLVDIPLIVILAMYHNGWDWGGSFSNCDLHHFEYNEKK